MSEALSRAKEFLAASKSDSALSQQILHIFGRQGMATAKEILKVATDSGYSFTQQEFEEAIKASISDPFKAGKGSHENQELLSITNPPESSCAWGCLSYTKTWHPLPIER